MFSPEYGVLLAETLKTQDPTNYWWSEKIDGVRGIWTGSQLLTRNNNKIYAPDWFLSQLPTTSLDGELFSTNFTTTLSIVSKKTPITSEWEKITFHVFDIPEIIAPYEQRLNTLISFRINSESLVWNILHPIQIKDPSHFHILHNQVIDSGGEGSMLRQPGSFYNTHRSPTLLKHKNFHDQEAIIKQKLINTKINNFFIWLPLLLPVGVWSFRIGILLPRYDWVVSSPYARSKGVEK